MCPRSPPTASICWKSAANGPARRLLKGSCPRVKTRKESVMSGWSVLEPVPVLSLLPGTPLARRLRAGRLAAGLTGPAVLARTGIDPGNLSRMENGKRVPTVATLITLAKLYGIPLATLAEAAAGAEQPRGGRAGLAGEAQPEPAGGGLRRHARPGLPRGTRAGVAGTRRPPAERSPVRPRGVRARSGGPGRAAPGGERLSLPRPRPEGPRGPGSVLGPYPRAGGRRGPGGDLPAQRAPPPPRRGRAWRPRAPRLRRGRSRVDGSTSRLPRTPCRRDTSSRRVSPADDRAPRATPRPGSRCSPSARACRRWRSPAR